MGNPRDSKVFGKSIRRLEDAALVSGRGRYVDDLAPEGCLVACFLRSPYAHASFQSINRSAALDVPGVVAIYTLADLRPHLTAEKLAVGLPSSSINMQVDRPLLAKDEVVYVGEPVVMVVAQSRSAAEDAIDQIEIDFAPLPVISDCRDAVADDAPPVHTSLTHNRLAQMAFSYGDCDTPFATAAHTVKASYRIHRGGSHSMEGRGVLARSDSVTGGLTVWSSTQTPHALKKFVCQLLGREEDDVKVIVPDVGGAFGPKLVTYPEEILVALSADLLRRPVKWIEDRREHFLSTTQERDQHWDVEMALDGAGHIQAIRGSMIHDHGAYTARGLNVPYGAGVTLPLPYNVPAYRLDITVALTNKVPVSPVRGAGQPQGAFVMERLMDRAADQIGLDRAEIRRRNLVRADQMPCEKPLKLRGGTYIVLDSGDYPACQAAAIDRAGWNEFASRRLEARRTGRRIGIGIANYVEGTGRGPFETVHVSVSQSGKVVVKTGASAMGQGTVTMVAQIVGEQLGGDLSNIIVHPGDTTNPLGFGGFNSRQTVVAGASAHQAAIEVRQKMLKIASHLLEEDESHLDLDGSNVVVENSNKFISFKDLAAAAAGLPGFQLPQIDTPGLTSTQQVNINDMAYSNGTAIAEVEVDEETGYVRILNVTLAHDCGRMVNPMTVNGQIIGAMAHGVGNALFEEMIYDRDAQPLTVNFADYRLITAAEMPDVDIVHTESPSPLNKLGLKGVGESGVIPITAAVASAVDDALSDLGVHVNAVPISPQWLRAVIKEKGAEF